MKTLIWFLGMIWLLSATIMPSSAQNCFHKIRNCLTDHLNQSTSTPEFDPRSPLFSESEFRCCPVVQQFAFNDKPCFCKAVPYTQGDSENATAIRDLFDYCNVTSPSFPLADFCRGTSPPLSSPVLPMPPPPETKNNTVGIAIGAAFGTLLFLTVIGVGFCCWKKKKHEQVAGYGTVREHGTRDLLGNSSTLINEMSKPNSLHYEFEALKVATNNFSDEGKLGHGEFGAVYKGVLQNGEEVAVKRLSTGSGQGDKEFKSEVEFVANLQHNNLVRLMGFCLSDKERLLVYEFMENQSLDYFLFDPEKQRELNWPKRYNIIGGIARGILYLHEDCPTRIIHRDLKAANILLDRDMNSKIADFGLARAFEHEQTQAQATQIAGTCGYMAPEFLMHGQYSVKSDVYSFGVLILEIVSGKRVNTIIHRPEGGENILSYAWRCLRDGVAMEFMDPTLKDSCAQDEIVRSIHMGLLCLHEDTKRRPTMAKLVHLFNSDVDANSLPLPTFPAFLFGGTFSEKTTSNVNGSMKSSSS